MKIHRIQSIIALRSEMKWNLKEIWFKVANWLLEEPKRLCRILILSICGVIVFFQLWECANKLLHPPISTHSHFDLNKTLFYPAVTFCRRPGFKKDVCVKYNMSTETSSTSSWRNFPFGSITLSEYFQEATFSRDEIFTQYSLKGLRDNVEVEETLHFTFGRCYTIKPKISTLIASKDSGYRFEVSHDFPTSDSDRLERENPGFHVYIHEANLRFTEHGVLSSGSGRVEYIYVLVNEVIEMKLTAQHFTQFRGRGGSCSDVPAVSSSICSENCRWRVIEDTVSCSGPWMINSKTTPCSNADDMERMIVQYNS